LRVLYVTLFAVVFDQITKIFVKGLSIPSLGISIPGMPYGSSKQVFGNFIKLTFIENPGMAFGILLSPRVLLPLITFLASVAIVYYIYRHRKDPLKLRLAFALILAGALGNLVDRTFYGLIYSYAPFFHGRVVDFLQIEFWDFTIFGKTYTTWPILNIADLAVTAGFVILFFNRQFLGQHYLMTVQQENEITNSDDTEEKSAHIQKDINNIISDYN
jgi:signal peptidase II